MVSVLDFEITFEISSFFYFICEFKAKELREEGGGEEKRERLGETERKEELSKGRPSIKSLDVHLPSILKNIKTNRSRCHIVHVQTVHSPRS